MKSRGHVERVVSLGRRIRRRGTKKLLALKLAVPFTFDNVSKRHKKFPRPQTTFPRHIYLCIMYAFIVYINLTVVVWMLVWSVTPTAFVWDNFRLKEWTVFVKSSKMKNLTPTFLSSLLSERMLNKIFFICSISIFWKLSRSSCQSGIHLCKRQFIYLCFVYLFIYLFIHPSVYPVCQSIYSVSQSISLPINHFFCLFFISLFISLFLFITMFVLKAPLTITSFPGGSST